MCLGASNSTINRVLCTGFGGAAVWAQLCGPWAQVTYSAAHTRVITFGGPKCVLTEHPWPLPHSKQYDWPTDNFTCKFHIDSCKTLETAIKTDQKLSLGVDDLRKPQFDSHCIVVTTFLTFTTHLLFLIASKLRWHWASQDLCFWNSGLQKQEIHAYTTAHFHMSFVRMETKSCDMPGWGDRSSTGPCKDLWICHTFGSQVKTTGRWVLVTIKSAVQMWQDRMIRLFRSYHGFSSRLLFWRYKDLQVIHIWHLINTLKYDSAGNSLRKMLRRCWDHALNILRV